MKRRLAAIIGITAGVTLIATTIFIGVGLLDTRSRAEAASTPAPQTTISPALSNETPAQSVVSNLPAAMIAGLPGYSDEHDRDTYVHIQTWMKICMNTHGYSYQFELAPQSGTVLGLVSTGFNPLPEGYDQGEQNALYGVPDNLLPDYDWQSGGCYGEAVHKAGILNDGSAGFTPDELAQITEVYDPMANPPEPTYGYAGVTPGFGASFDPAVAKTVDASITACMSRNGIDYTHTDNINPDGSALLNEGAFMARPISGENTPTFLDDAFVVLYGARVSADQPYDWQKGGCYGAAIHEAGIDR
ncbi:hypothetical protein ITJ38_14500 [Agreia pratensis]|uniref:hypothetical protein n=1 Tax=Agreia pratensis TaxID=150121 RepID=UPI00188DAEE8|nr:hypothetical protein [Agreia pratensis]MBF4635620.1 hypothetical protein [Agreia pratensis]